MESFLKVEHYAGEYFITTIYPQRSQSHITILFHPRSKEIPQEGDIGLSWAPRLPPVDQAPHSPVLSGTQFPHLNNGKTGQDGPFVWDTLFHTPILASCKGPAQDPRHSLFLLLTVPDLNPCRAKASNIPDHPGVIILLKLRHQSYTAHCQLPMAALKLRASGYQPTSWVSLSS